MTYRKINQSPSPSLLKRFLLSAILALILLSAFAFHDFINTVYLPPSSEEVELYANQTGSDLTLLFTKAIGDARHSVLLSVYSLTDPSVIQALRDKSLESVEVKVLCDANASPNINHILGKNVKVIRRYGPGLMHQKILVIDKQKIWIGSANMTTESLHLHGNLVTAIDNESLANEIHDKVTSLKSEGKGPSFPHYNFLIGEQDLELWFLPDSTDAVNRIKKLINSAKKTLKIAMFTWTRNDLALAVSKAAERGIKTEVVIDHRSAKGASAKIVKLLAEKGVEISISRGGPLLHHKFLIVDNKTLVNGSANWTKAAFTANDDTFLIINNLTNTQQQQMNALWHVIQADSLKIH